MESSPSSLPETSLEILFVLLDNFGGSKVERKALLRLDPCLEQALSAAKDAWLPNICISNQQGQYLPILSQIIGAKNVLEIGALGGHSIIWLAKGGAHVTSVEIDPKHQAVVSPNTKGQGFDNVDAILGSASDALPKLVQESKTFDFVFIDVGWDDQWENFEFTVKLTRVGGCIYAGDVVTKMLFQEESKEKQSLLKNVRNMKSVDATLVNIIAGFRGHAESMVHGFLLAVVKE